jgi:hypothetical protein
MMVNPKDRKSGNLGIRARNASPSRPTNENIELAPKNCGGLTLSGT